MAEMVIVWPRGVRTEVPVDVCRCPILHVGDACPVHQQVLDVTRHMLRQTFLSVEEVNVLAIALAVCVNPFATPSDATEAARDVHAMGTATQIQRSLATHLAELTY